MKHIYKQMTKAMALVALFLTVGVNAWGATTVWDGSTLSSSIWTGGSTSNWAIDPTQYFEIVSGTGFWIKSDASGTQGLNFNSAYHAIVVKYHHRTYMKCSEDRTVCFTMEGANNTAHIIEFVNDLTGEVIERKVSHARSTTQGAGSAFTVDFNANVQYELKALASEINIKKIEYLVPGQDIITLEETTDNNTNINTLKNLASTVREVKINRTLKAGQWNTFCSPVALSASTEPSLEEILLCNKVYMIGSYDATENTLTFTSSTTLPANTPVLVKPDANVSNIVFEAKNINKPASASTLEASSNGLKFVGLYGSKNIFEVDNSYFLGSDGTTLFYPESSEKGTIKGFRAYFELPDGASVKALSFEDDATGIISVEKDIFSENGNVYSVDGRLVGNSKENLTRGMYIQNGRKFIVK